MNVAEILNALPQHDLSWLNAQATGARLDESLASELVREQWKYTPIKGFVESFRGRNSQPAATAFTGADQPQMKLVQFNDATGEDLAYLSTVLDGGVFCERYPLADLTALVAGDGTLIRVLETPAEPLVIDFCAAGCSPIVVSVAPNVHLEIIETASAAGFHTEFLHIDIAAHATLQHARSALAVAAGQWSLLQASLATGASYSLHSYATGGKRRRIDTQILLRGRGARVEIDGAYVVETGCHLDQQTIVEHQAPDTFSRQQFHGMGLGKSKTTFNGRIHIHRHAPRSDAALTNKNLAMDPAAEINTKPELEIYTDDVKCSHGATVGQLSDEAIYYLRSRGVPEADARALLAKAFLKTCLHGRLAETVEQRFLEAL